MALKDLWDKFIDWAFGALEIKEDPEYKNYKETLDKLMDIVNRDSETFWTATGAKTPGFSNSSSSIIHLFCPTKYFELFDLFLKEKGKKKVNTLSFASNYERIICSAVGVTIDKLDYSYINDGFLVVLFNVDFYKTQYVYRSHEFMEKFFPKDMPIDTLMYNTYKKDFDYYGLTLELEGEQFVTKYPEDWRKTS